jgi:hypothetical protein
MSHAGPALSIGFSIKAVSAGGTIFASIEIT